MALLITQLQLPDAFQDHLSLTTTQDMDGDIHNDLERELTFYKQSLAAVQDARQRCKKDKIPFTRPVDYFAEMLKTDGHMEKIKQSLLQESQHIKASEEAKKKRDGKKFGKKVQVEKELEKQKRKAKEMDSISEFKKKRKGQDLVDDHRMDFDVQVQDVDKKEERKKKYTKPAQHKRKAPAKRPGKQVRKQRHRK
jgi:rRNA-processing protein EBP2